LLVVEELDPLGILVEDGSRVVGVEELECERT